jgi:hypothetical protein
MGPKQARGGPQCLETIRAGVVVYNNNDLGNSAVSEWVGRLGGEGFWMRDYGGGTGRVGRPFGARRFSPVRGLAR